MTQILLFPDPRPLVERLGPEFFRNAPQEPGVYLMRDRADTVLYVGKAKNLRKRLASYRVANPDRMPRRHLRMLRAVERIELQPCVDEPCALAQESRLLRTLRPPFNRAGAWPGIPRFLAWRTTEQALEFAVTQTTESDWHNYGPLGTSAFQLRASLARLLWCALHPEGGLASLPQGWSNGKHPEISIIPRKDAVRENFDDSAARLKDFFSGQAEGFSEWMLACTAALDHPFDRAVRDADLESVTEFTNRKRWARVPVQSRRAERGL